MQLFLLWFLLSSELSASGDIMPPSNGRQQPGAISLEERQRVEYEDAESYISLSISASARIVSVFRWIQTLGSSLSTQKRKTHGEAPARGTLIARNSESPAWHGH